MANLDLQVRLNAFDNASSPLRRLMQTSRELQTSLQRTGINLDRLSRLKAQADGFEPLRQKTRALGETLKPLQTRINALNETLGKQREKQAGLNQTIAAGEKAYKQYDQEIARITRSLERMDERKKADPAQRAALRAKRERLIAEQKLEGESLSRLNALRERYGRFVDRNAHQLSALDQQLRENRQGYQAMRNTLLTHRQALRQEGYDVRDISSTQRRLGQEIDRTTRALRRQQQAMNLRQAWAGHMEAFRGSMGRARVVAENGAFVGGGAIMAGQQILRGFSRLGHGARGFVDTAQKFERFQTILKTTEGSAKAAQASMAWISDFAVKTPYELDETTDAFVRLRAYGMDPTKGLLQTLGDTSAAMGKPLMQAVEAIADAITGENERLKEFGIKASKKGGVISYTYTDKAGIQQLAQAAADNRQQIEETLSRIWNEKYGGAMGELAATFGGTVANLGDQWTRFQKMVMDSGVFTLMTDRIKGLLGALDDMAANGEMQKWAQDLADIMYALFDTIWETARSIAGLIRAAAPWIRANKDLVVWAGKWLFYAGVFLSAFGPVYVGFSVIAAGAIKFVATLKLVAAGFKILTMAMMSNPLVLAIAAFVVAAWLLYQHWDKVSAYLLARWEAIKQWWANFSFTRAVRTAFAGIGNFFKTIGNIMWDSIKTTVDNIKNALQNMDTEGAIRAAFQGGINFLLTLGGYFGSILVEAGKEVIVAILGWDVYNTMVNLFSKAIKWVVQKVDFLIGKIQQAWNKLKELLGLSEENKSILANDPKPTFAERQAAYIRYNENKAEIDAKLDAVLNSTSGVLSPQAVDSIKKRISQPQTAAELIQQLQQAKPAASVKKSAQTVTIENKVDVNVNAEGVGLKEVAGMITREVKQSLNNATRDLASRSRSALYDHA